MEGIKTIAELEKGLFRQKYTLVFLLLLICMSCQSSKAFSSISEEIVAYSGFALMGSPENFGSRYKYSVNFEELINKKLFESVWGLQPQYYKLITDEIIDADKGSSIAVAFALENEKVIIEKIANSYNLTVSLNAQALVIDFDSTEGAIIASYPVQLPQQWYSAVYEGREPNDQEISNIIKMYFLGGLTLEDRHTKEEVSFGSLVEQFSVVIKNAPIKGKYAQEIGIGSIDFKKTVKNILPEQYKNNTQGLELELGQFLAARLSKNQGVSVVPNNIDNSSAQMALRFTGSKSARFLTLPKPDYLLNMSVRAIDSQVYEKTKTSQVNSYISVINFTLQPNLGPDSKKILSINFRDGLFKEFPKTMVIDGWYQQKSSMYYLIDRFSRNIDDPRKDPDWADGQMLDKNDYKQLKKLNEVLEKCR